MEYANVAAIFPFIYQTLDSGLGLSDIGGDPLVRYRKIGQFFKGLNR